MSRFAFILAAAVSVFGADLNLTQVLRGIENRYNRAQTLQVGFQEVYSGPGRPRRTESGTLYLRKPGRMRWEYASPKGKLFLIDGKFVYLYTPNSNRVEKMKVKESDDMRAPLAFLIGRLDFQKDFGRYEWRRDETGIRVRAFPKSDRLAYTLVEFTVDSDYRIRLLTVTGQDRSQLEFSFEGEQRNPALAPRLFQFEAPAGAEVLEVVG